MKPNLWTIAKPCTANWETMRGDDRRRFCEQCRKHVHNVSAMSAPERAEFAAAPGERCVIYFQRANGDVADLSLLARLRRWFPFLRLASWSTLAALLPVLLTGCMGVRRPQSTTGMMAVRKPEPIAAPQAATKNPAPETVQQTP